jgi:hypothetical protein
LRDLPADLSEEWPVDVTFHFSAGGRLKVDAQVRYTDRVVHLEMLRTTGMSFELIRAWRGLVVGEAGLGRMRALLEKEQHPPIALASSGGEQAPRDESAPRLSALASRYAAYLLGLFGRSTTEPSHSEGDPTATSPRDAAASKEQPS